MWLLLRTTPVGILLSWSSLPLSPSHAALRISLSSFSLPSSLNKAVVPCRMLWPLCEPELVREPKSRPVAYRIVFYHIASHRIPLHPFRIARSRRSPRGSVCWLTLPPPFPPPLHPRVFLLNYVPFPRGVEAVISFFPRRRTRLPFLSSFLLSAPVSPVCIVRYCVGAVPGHDRSCTVYWTWHEWAEWGFLS